MTHAADDVRVALATYAGLPELTADDRLLLPALRALGVHAVPAVWDDTGEDWDAYDVVVIRSCWDYHWRPREFLGWLDGVEAGGARLVNPAALLRWNADKRYLRQLASLGVPIVQTEWIEPPASAVSLHALLQRTGWTDVVIKPAISASAADTWRAHSTDLASSERRIAALLSASPAGVLVQPFVSEVSHPGEWSIVFIAHEYSHAALKTPAAGDFRVQEEHGGTALPSAPSQALIADAASLLDTAAACAGIGATDIAYARVDGIERGGRLVLMELECLEPHLFLDYRDDAAPRLARAIATA